MGYYYGYYGGGGGYYTAPGGYNVPDGGFYAAFGNYGGYGSGGGFEQTGSKFANGLGGYTYDDDGLSQTGSDPNAPPPPPGGGSSGGYSYVAQHATQATETISLLGRDITLNNEDASDPNSAVAIQKIESAVADINAHAGSLSQSSLDALNGLSSLTYTASTDRSGTDLPTGAFTLSSEMNNAGVAEIATDLIHDGEHVSQYEFGDYDSIHYNPNTGAPTTANDMSQAVALEQEATRIQLQDGDVLGLSSTANSRLTSYESDTGAIASRLSQTPAH